MEYYSVIKKNEILPFAAIWMDSDSLMRSEISQTENDKYCMISLIWYVASKKYNQLVNITKKKQTHRYRGQASGYQWGGRGSIGVGEWEVQTIGCKTGYKDVLYNTSNIANIL